jgi:rhamnose transport system ATP-binding protein
VIHAARAPTGQPVLELSETSKSFGGVPALRGVAFTVRAGEIHALVGENGAGKSTLVNILSGVLGPDGGELRLDGAETRFGSPREAAHAGIHLVHQELALLPESTVVENVFLGEELAGRGGVLRRREMRERTAEVLGRLGVVIAPDARVSSLTVAQRQMVEIARSLVSEARVVILDEPTAALSPEEAEALFVVLRGLRAAGCAIVYISHRIGEVLALADNVTVLKDGEVVGTWPASGLTPSELVRRMVGRPIEDLFPPDAPRTPDAVPVLEVRGLIDPPAVTGVDLVVHAGEILGLAGLEGQGQDELLACLAGDRIPVRGSLRVRGEEAAWGGVRRMIGYGIGFIPEDRKTRGLLLEQSSIRNISLPSLPGLTRHGWVQRRREDALGREAARRVGVRGAIESPVQSLSGGNQQKVVLAKWLARQRSVLLLNQPTRGVDVGAKGEIYALLREFADAGGAAVLTSRELPEILGLCDRVMVVRGGGIVATLERGATEEQVMSAATTGSASRSGGVAMTASGSGA